MHRIETEILEIEAELKLIAVSMGVVQFARAVGLKKSEISNWLHNRRNWSYKKILKTMSILEE